MNDYVIVFLIVLGIFILGCAMTWGVAWLDNRWMNERRPKG